MHDSSKILMGHVPSTAKEIDNRESASGTPLAAGLRVCLNNAGKLSVAAADGVGVGISCGKDLSNTNRTTVVRTGLKVPIKLASGFTTPVIGAQVAVSDTTGEAMAYTGSGDSYINAKYSSGAKTSINEDGTETANGAALIDFEGGI